MRIAYTLRTRTGVWWLAGLLAAAPAHAAQVGEERIAQTFTDAGTGATIQVSVGGGADLTIAVEAADVSLRKQMHRDRTVTTIVFGPEHIRLSASREGLLVTGTLGTVEALTPETRSSARALLANSAAMARALTLLGRLQLPPRSVLGHTLLVTRATLLAETGDPGGIDDLRRWVDRTRRALDARPPALAEGQGPGQCWEEYKKEAIAAYMEYEECMKGLSWKEFLDQLGCATIYDMRAIGAFSWWLKCVAIK